MIISSKKKTIEEIYRDVASKIVDFANKSSKPFIRQRFRGNNESHDFFSFVFLCGGDRTKYNSREVLTNIFFDSSPNIQIIISEDLASLRGKLDLLTFEKLLESISKMILIPVESMGTACELGAFTYLNEANKEVAIINEKYHDDNSFINDGPIALLKSLDDNRVIYAQFEERDKKTYLIENKDIKMLPYHRLLREEIKFDNYFTKESADSNSITICNISSFFAVVLDILCLFGVGNPDAVLDFLKSIHQVNRVR